MFSICINVDKHHQGWAVAMVLIMSMYSFYRLMRDDMLMTFVTLSILLVSDDK